MHIIIIPGFIGYPEEKTFIELEQILILLGHSVTKVGWPHFPDNLDQYNFTTTINHARKIISKVQSEDLILLGFSMGGIIATQLAKEFSAKKLGLIVSPYRVGSNDDLEGKYKQWKQEGVRELTSSKFGKLVIPFSFVEDASKYNVLDLISDVHCPVLFIVAENDEKIRLSVSKEFFEKANVPKQWHIVAGMQHKYQYQAEMLEQVNQILVNFIQSNNG